MRPFGVLPARVCAALLGLGVILGAANAAAYCRTTTCNPNWTCQDYPEDCCILDGFGCDINGAPIAWPTSCVSFNVDEEGSALRNISSDELSSALDEAYDQWLSADCGAGGPISLALENRGKSECAPHEFNEDPGDRNANIWMFRDDSDSSDGASIRTDMDLDAATLAVAIVSFNPKTAEIYDVDVELNSNLAPFTNTEGKDGAVIDLAAVVTHEAGHFLGLDHSRAPGATMGSGYDPGSIDARDLSNDDIAGICAIYPDDRTISEDNQTCEPRGKYSPKCEGAGCDCGIARSWSSEAPARAPWFALGVLGALYLRRRMRA